MKPKHYKALVLFLIGWTSFMFLQDATHAFGAGVGFIVFYIGLQASACAGAMLRFGDYVPPEDD